MPPTRRWFRAPSHFEQLAEARARQMPTVGAAVLLFAQLLVVMGS